jgi:hypothetical protein
MEQGEHKNHRQSINYSHPLPSRRDLINVSLSQKEMVETLRLQWKKLWQQRAEDKIRAEGIATADYCDLFVEKGTIIHATRDFRTPRFREILEQHHVENVDRLLPPDPFVGGWTKFIKTKITNQKSRKGREAEFYCADSRCRKQQPKKGGRGWLHK